MVKQRAGSRRGMTKFTTSAKRTARKRAAAPKPISTNSYLASSWDRSCTPEANMKNLGLQSRVNQVSKSRKGHVRVIQIPRQDMPKDETALRKLVARAERGERKKLVIRPGERRSLNGLIGKYGDDYDGMARDLKLNYLQWTSGQLRKRVERMREADEANAGNE